MEAVIRVIGSNGSLFSRAGVADGRSAHRRHEFLEAHQVQHPFEVVGQRRQASFTPHLFQSFHQKVRVAKPALDDSKAEHRNSPAGRQRSQEVQGEGGRKTFLCSAAFPPSERRLLAPRFDHRNRRQVRRQLVRGKRLDLERKQAGEGHAEFHRAVRAVHNRRDAGYVSAVRADDVNRLLHAAALGHNILDDEDFFAGRDFESAPQHQLAILFFRKNKPRAKLPRDFLADDQSAERGRDDGDGAERAGLVRQRAADFFDNGHLLEREGALKVLAAVQAAAEDEMAFEQRATVAENLEDFVLCHRRSFKFSVFSFKLIRRLRRFSQIGNRRAVS